MPRTEDLKQTCIVIELQSHFLKEMRSVDFFVTGNSNTLRWDQIKKKKKVKQFLPLSLLEPTAFLKLSSCWSCQRNEVSSSGTEKMNLCFLEISQIYSWNRHIWQKIILLKGPKLFMMSGKTAPHIQTKKKKAQTIYLRKRFHFSF